MSNENITRQELVSILRFALSVLTKDAKNEVSGTMATDEPEEKNKFDEMQILHTFDFIFDTNYPHFKYKHREQAKDFVLKKRWVTLRGLYEHAREYHEAGLCLGTINFLDKILETFGYPQCNVIPF